MTGKSLLSDEGILHNLKSGKIVIEPFNLKQLGNCSYDVALGRHFYRETTGDGAIVVGDNKSLEKLWKPGKVIFNAEEEYIKIDPEETILGHTNEFIGGRENITSHLQTRSTMGRIGISLCKCSGWGDCSYINRWTLEITNHLRHHAIYLKVGYPVGQIIFHETDRESKEGYVSRYQLHTDLPTIMKTWSPELMLPKFKE